MIRIRLANMAETVKSLGMINNEMVQAVRRGLQAWGEETRTLQLRRTPVDTGALIGTVGYKTRISGQKAQGESYAGGPAAPYALVVHEMVGLHPRSGRPVTWSKPGSGPKYLENPIKERMHLLDRDIAAELNALLARATKR